MNRREFLKRMAGAGVALTFGGAQAVGQLVPRAISHPSAWTLLSRVMGIHVSRLRAMSSGQLKQLLKAYVNMKLGG